MLFEDYRSLIERSPRANLGAIRENLWRVDWPAGRLTDDQAQGLDDFIQARLTAPAVAVAAPRAARPSPGRPPRVKDPARLERRGRWSASSWMPAHIAGLFTLAERALLNVVAYEVKASGSCCVCYETLGRRAGVSKATVKRAMRLAETLNLIAVERRPVRPFRHAPNVVTIVSREWLAWLRIGGAQGVQWRTPMKRRVEREGSERACGPLFRAALDARAARDRERERLRSPPRSAG